MARRRNRFGRVWLIAIAVIAIVGIGGYLLLSGTFSETGDSLLFFGNEKAIFTFDIAKNSGLSCTLDTQIDVIDPANNRFIFDDKAPLGFDVFTTFQITSLTVPSGGIEIKLLDPKAKVKCSPVASDFSINLVGGWTNVKWEIEDQNGVYQTVSSVTKQIPTISRSIKNTEVLLPTNTVLGSDLETKANIKNVISKNVKVRMTFSSNMEIKTSATGTLLNTGAVSLSTAGYVKIVPDVAPPTSSLGTLVDIVRVTPSAGFCFTGTPDVSCGGTTRKIVPVGGQMSLTITGMLDKWTPAEGAPFVRILDPKGVQVGGNIVLSSAKDLGNGNWEFTRIGVDIPRTITTSNIKDNQGTWFIEMHSNGDVRRNSAGIIKDVYTFTLQDLSALVGTGCIAPKIKNPTTGNCEDPVTTPPSSPSCLTDTEYREEAKKLSDDQLILTINTLEAQTSGTSCISQQLRVYTEEFNARGIDPNKITGTEVTGAVGKIRYIANYEPSGGESNEGCQDVKTVPETGVPLQAFQLVVSGGSKCDGFRFGSIEIRPILDFGGNNLKTINIDKNSVKLNHKLFMSVNNPFPPSPQVDCVITSQSIPQQCSILNHDFTKDPAVSLKVEEVTFIREPTDRDLSPEYQLSLVGLTANSLEDKLRNSGIKLVKGDVYSYMVFVTGTFDATKDGSPVKGVIPPLILTQSFTYQEYGGIICDNEKEVFNKITNTCEPIPRKTCDPPLILDEATNTCTTTGGIPPSECKPIPTCKGNENLEVTDQKDACGSNILQCVPIQGEPIPPTSPNDKPILKKPTSAGGCETGYALNSLGNCQLIGSGSTCVGTGCEPKATTTGGGFCSGKDFNFAKCFASLFKPKEGTEGGFTLTGTTLVGVIIFVVVIIVLVIVAVVIRRKSGGGINPF